MKYNATIRYCVRIVFDFPQFIIIFYLPFTDLKNEILKTNLLLNHLFSNFIILLETAAMIYETTQNLQLSLKMDI